MGESVHHGLGLQITRPAARNARQFATNAKREFVGHAKNQGMKTAVILLLTDDNGLEDWVAQALSEIGGVSHLTRDDDDKHIEALAYANGATACFRKPLAVAQLVRVIDELQRLKPEVAPA